jgi:SOS-response transcriptional repressor LexA
MKRIEKKSKNGSPFVGQKIRAARKVTALTLDAVGRRIGVSIQALSAIERGVANPSKQTLINLAKVLEDDFGEHWLREFVPSRHDESLSNERTEVEAAPGFSPPPLDELILQWAMEAQEASKLPRPVKLFNQKSALVPIHHEIINGTTLIAYEGGDKAGIPYHLVRSLEKTRCIRVCEEPIRDAFISAGDVVVLHEKSLPEEGKIVLALLDKQVVVRRWELIGRKVKLSPLDSKYEPLIVTRNKVEFIGELMGVLRFICYITHPTWSL